MRVHIVGCGVDGWMSPCPGPTPGASRRVHRFRFIARGTRRLSFSTTTRCAIQSRLVPRPTEGTHSLGRPAGGRGRCGFGSLGDCQWAPSKSPGHAVLVPVGEPPVLRLLTLPIDSCCSEPRLARLHLRVADDASAAGGGEHADHPHVLNNVMLCARTTACPHTSIAHCARPTQTLRSSARTHGPRREHERGRGRAVAHPWQCPSG